MSGTNSAASPGRRVVRVLSTMLLAAGFLALVWALVIWRWRDSMTAVYTRWEQRKLSGQLETLPPTYAPSKARLVAAVGKAPSPAAVKARKVAVQGLAERLRESTASGQALGRIHVDRLGVDMILVDGTNHDALVRGPGVEPAHAPAGRGPARLRGRPPNDVRRPVRAYRPAPQGRSDRDGDALWVVRLSRHVPRDRAGRRSRSPSHPRTRRAHPAGVPSTILRARALHRLRGSSARERAHLGLGSRRPPPTSGRDDLPGRERLSHVLGRTGQPGARARRCPGTRGSAARVDGSAGHRPAVEAPGRARAAAGASGGTGAQPAARAGARHSRATRSPCDRIAIAVLLVLLPFAAFLPPRGAPDPRRGAQSRRTGWRAGHEARLAYRAPSATYYVVRLLRGGRVVRTALPRHADNRPGRPLRPRHVHLARLRRVRDDRRKPDARTDR